MHDLLEHTTEPIITSATPATYTEEQASDYLAEFVAGQRPSVRTIAKRWGWSKSRVDRFLRDSDGTAAGHGHRTPEELRTLLVNGAKTWDAKQPTAEHAADELINKRSCHRTPAPPLSRSAKSLIATAANPKGSDDFEWTADNPDLVAPHQDAIAVYMNGYGQIVIRAEARVRRR